MSGPRPKGQTTIAGILELSHYRQSAHGSVAATRISELLKERSAAPEVADLSSRDLYHQSKVNYDPRMDAPKLDRPRSVRLVCARRLERWIVQVPRQCQLFVRSHRHSNKKTRRRPKTPVCGLFLWSMSAMAIFHQLTNRPSLRIADLRIGIGRLAIRQLRTGL